MKVSQKVVPKVSLKWIQKWVPWIAENEPKPFVSHVRCSTLILTGRSCSEWDLLRNSGNSNTFDMPGGHIKKDFVSLMFLHGSMAAHARTWGHPGEPSKSLRNHCQQQLVALFTPTLHHGHLPELMGDRAGPC